MPKAAKALLSQRAPKRVKNDAYEEANSAAERYRGATMISSNEWGGRTPGGEQPEVMSNEFPVMINKPNRDRDTRLRLKKQYIAAKAAGTGPDLGAALLDDKDLEAFQDIEKQSQVISFESFLASYFDMNDPATAKLVEEIMPEYYQKRAEAIEHQAELQKNMALIRLRGPQSKKDLMLIYLLATGAIPMPLGGIFDPKKWSYTDRNFTRGMLNPRKYHNPVVQLSKRDPIGDLMRIPTAGATRVTGPGGLNAATSATLMAGI